MQTVQILRFNNYINHTLKVYSTADQYSQYVVNILNDYNFNPSDGVATEIITVYPIYIGDYVLVLNENNSIDSRWFIMDQSRLSRGDNAGMYSTQLYRDVIADNISRIKDSPMLVERALLKENDNLIYNSEDILVNQIKTKETLIKDNTGVPWIIGYLNRSYAGGKIEGNLEITPFRTYNTLEEFEYHNYIDNWFNGYTSDESTWFTLYWNKLAYLNKWIRSWDIKSNSITQNSDWKSTQFLGYRTQINGVDGDFPSLAEIKSTFGTNTWIQDIRDRFGIKSLEQTNSLLSYDNVIIKVAETYYRIHIKDDPRVYEETLNRNEATDNAPTIKSLCESLNGSLIPTPFDQAVYTFHSSGIRYKVELEILSANQGFSFTIPAQRPVLDDAPYDMFAIPYGKYNNYGDKQIAMKTASTIMTTLNVGSSADLYDVQLLPFSPTLSTTTTDIKDVSDKVIGKIYWANESSFSKTILLDQPIGVDNKKIDNICNKYRLVSPNYSGQFEFTAAANNGISGFKVDCTYMPINPYIRVAPLFGGLYGSEFEDARGLICGGDFSLPVVNSAWVSYQQNNKNYQAIFDRQISNMEFTNDINRKMDVLNAITGTVQGTTAGAMAGSAFGPYGAIAGAVVGGVSSAVGGVADMAINESVRKEQMSYTRDLFKLNLGNIQAQPYSLSKTTAFTANNKIFPILEYYTCSDREKIAVANQIAQFSMNVGVIGTLQEYITNSWSYQGIYARKYFKGRLLQTSIHDDDYHIVNAINQELQGGIYLDEYIE